MTLLDFVGKKTSSHKPLVGLSYPRVNRLTSLTGSVAGGSTLNVIPANRLASLTRLIGWLTVITETHQQ